MNVPNEPAFGNPVATPAPGPRRRPLFWPVVLIGVGVAALLFNLGWLDWDRLGRLFQLWPLLLIAAGVGIVLRGRVPGRLASIVGAVILVLILVAIGGVLASIPGSFSGSTGPVVTSHFSAPAAEVTAPTLDLSAGASHITVRGGNTGTALYLATISSRAGDRPDVNLDAATGTVHVSLPSRSDFHWGWDTRQREVDLTLNDKLPWTVRLADGASTSNLDLSTLKLTSIDLSTGASTIVMQLPRPTGNVPVRVSGGAMHLSIERPAGVPIRVTGSGGATSLSVDGQQYGGIFHEGQSFISPGYEAAADRFDIAVESGASSITIR